MIHVPCRIGNNRNTVLPFLSRATVPIEKMLLTRIIRPAVGARTKDSRAPLSMFSASTIRRMLQDPTTRATEAVCVYRRSSLTLRIRQQQLASKFHCPPRKRFDAKGIREELSNTVCSWWFIWRMMSLYDSKNYDGDLNGRDYSCVLWGVLCDVARCNTPPSFPNETYNIHILH